MKKSALIVALCVLFAAATASAVPMEDKQFRTGLKYYNGRNYKAAAKQFKEYVKKQPDPAAYYLIGYSLYKLRKFNESNEYFKEAYLIAPDFSPEQAGLIEKAPKESKSEAAAP